MRGPCSHAHVGRSTTACVSSPRRLGGLHRLTHAARHGKVFGISKSMRILLKDAVRHKNSDQKKIAIASSSDYIYMYMYIYVYNICVAFRVCFTHHRATSKLNHRLKPSFLRPVLRSLHPPPSRDSVTLRIKLFPAVLIPEIFHLGMPRFRKLITETVSGDTVCIIHSDMITYLISVEKYLE